MENENAERKRRNWWRIEGDHFLLNAEATARFFGVTPRSLRDWVERGCPQGQRGWYDPAAVMKWRGGEGRTGDSTAGESMEARKLRAETEYRERKAERERLNLEAQRGLYFERAFVESEWAKRILELKNGLQAIPRKAAMGIADPMMKRQVERVVSDAIYELLDQYARTGTYTPRQKGTRKATEPGEQDPGSSELASRGKGSVQAS